MCTARPPVTGYRHPDYATSLGEFGRPRHLPLSDGWILQRPIPSSPHKDAMGVYPFFTCRHWHRLAADLDGLEADLVSLIIVTDPFADCNRHTLEKGFQKVLPYKDHYVADLSNPPESFIKKSHQATVRRARKWVEVEVCETPLDRLEVWLELFSVLTRRHGISGLRAFSERAFATQLAIPGLVMFEARSNGEIVGLDLWYVMDDIAYGHLVAFSDLGYKLRASYATKWEVLAYFYKKVRWVDFGAGAGLSAKSSGLTDFKRGWSTGTKPVYLCSRIFQPGPYRELATAKQAEHSEYFPAYRMGEFS